MGKDVIDFSLQFLNEGFLPANVCCTCVTLLSKVESPESITQFRPIRLFNVSFKLFIKVMTNRIRRVFPNIISQVQSSFIPGRVIHDNVIILEEVIQSI